MKQKKNPQEQVTKIHLFYRLFLPCFAAAPAPSAVSPPTKKRLSTSLREDDDTILKLRSSVYLTEDGNVSDGGAPASARPSKTMVIGTIFGTRRGHVWFCVQHDRLSSKPYLLIELSIPTQHLVQEMRSGEIIRLALESSSNKNPDLVSCSLRSVPGWTVSCNGRKLGFAARRKVTEQISLLLKTMESVSVGTGVIPAGPDTEAVMYMRANYEHVVGSADSESFHLINPDGFPGGQELSLFLLRSQ